MNFSGNLIQNNEEALESAVGLLETLSANDSGRVTVTIDIPKGGMVKLDKEGGIDFISPVPVPFNYGHIFGKVIENGDGDFLDAILLGPRADMASEVNVVPVGIVSFIHRGAEDHKVVCMTENYEISDWDMTLIDRFFTAYAPIRKTIDFVKGYWFADTRYNGVSWRLR